MFNVNKAEGIATVIHILDVNNFSFSDQLGRKDFKKRDKFHKQPPFPLKGMSLNFDEYLPLVGAGSLVIAGNIS